MLVNGYVKFFRKLKTNEWYKKGNTIRLFIHCLLSANYEKNSWQGIDTVEGEFITSLNLLSTETGLSKQNIRTSLSHLILTHQLTQRIAQGLTRKYTVIKVVNWELYQVDESEFNTIPNTSLNTQSNTQLTHNQHNNQHTINTIVINKEDNNKRIKEEKKKDIIESNDSLSVFTDDEVEKTQKNEKIDFDFITNYWNSNSQLANITKITDLRKVNVNARIKEFGLESVYKMIDNISKSPFLKGENNRQWVATFDWCFKPKNFVKVVEGNFLENGKNGNGETDLERRVRLVNERLGEL